MTVIGKWITPNLPKAGKGWADPQFDDNPWKSMRLPGAWQSRGHWPYLSEAQAQVLSEPATAMAVTIDIGDPTDIHPRNKQQVARRLALLALARCYGQNNLDISGPAVPMPTTVGYAWRDAPEVNLRNAAGLPAAPFRTDDR